MANKAVLGFLAGAAIGAIAGILFAPDKGSETRRKISKKTGDVTDSVKNAFSDFIDGMKNTYSSLKGEVEDVEEKGKAKVNQLKQEAKNALS
jgi:gas vesicle protein